MPLAKESQLFFAFEWQNPEISFNGQLTWTHLPQGFKNSPTLFDEALHEDLGEYRLEHLQLTLLQYVDDILIAADDVLSCQQGTKDLLTALCRLGYRVSAKKAQICQQEVVYLGYILKEGHRWLTDARMFLCKSYRHNTGEFKFRKTMLRRKGKAESRNSELVCVSI